MPRTAAAQSTDRKATKAQRTIGREHSQRIRTRFSLAFACVALLALFSFAPVALATKTLPVTQAQLNSSVNSITGTDDAGKVQSKQECSAPSAGHAGCAAQALVLKSTGKLIHPHLHRAYSIARTELRLKQKATASPFAAEANTEPGADPLPQAGTPAYLQQAYDLAYLSQTHGAGETVAIVDAYSDPSAASDLATYRSYFGLPACTTSNGCLNVVDDATTTDNGWDAEISLDLDAVSAICPLCKIDLVEGASNSFSDLNTAVQQAHSLGANEISNSWGSTTDSGDLSFPGVGSLYASGDSGYTGVSQYPASYPDVTAVGGTSLVSAPASARGYRESGWLGTGSGCNTAEAKPSYQLALDQTGCTGRSYNDISADADPSSGLDIYDSQSDVGGWALYGGTSLATPITAAYYALLEISPTQAWPYQNASSLNDITSGMNIFNTGCLSAIIGICEAGTGFDGLTGNGSISGASITGAPEIGSNGNGASTVTSTSYSVNAGVYPNGADTKVRFEYGTTTAYGQSTAAQDIGVGTQAVPVHATFTGVAAGSTLHYRVVAQNSYGTTYGYDTSSQPPAGAPVVTSTGVSTWTFPTKMVVNYQAVLGAHMGTVECDYGTTTAYGSSTVMSGDNSGTFTGSLLLEGLQPDTTYHYQLAANDGLGTYTTSDQTFVTPPGVAVSAGMPSPVGPFTATLTGTVSPEHSPGTAYFEYGTTTAYGTQTPVQEVSDATNSVAVSKQITGLAPLTTYHWALVATSNGETEQTADGTFTTPAPAAQLSNTSASSIGFNGATLSGTANAETTTGTTYFEYGTTTAYGQTTSAQPLTGTANTHESATLTGLTPATTYHYALVDQMTGGTTVTSADGTFTTPAQMTLGDASVNTVLAQSAAFTGTANSQGNTSTWAYFEYGTTTSYGQQTQPVSLPVAATNTPIFMNASNLAPATTYHYALVVSNQFGQFATTDQTFTTLPVQIDTSVQGQPSARDATLSVAFYLNGAGPGTAWVQYGPSSGVMSTTQMISVDGSTMPPTFNLSGLMPSTTYRYFVSFVTGGHQVNSQTMTFTTPAAPATSNNGGTHSGSGPANGSSNGGGNSSSPARPAKAPRAPVVKIKATSHTASGHYRVKLGSSAACTVRIQLVSGTGTHTKTIKSEKVSVKAHKTISISMQAPRSQAKNRLRVIVSVRRNGRFVNVS